MKKAFLPLFIGLVALTGCAHHYVMMLDNSEQVTTATKPELENGVYHFKDAKGEEHFVPEFRVHKIEPLAMAERENKPHRVKANPQKKRKWYLLWLA
jgi:hypothetical protein